MPLMGEDFSFEIESATAGTYLVVADMNSFDNGAGGSESLFPTFDRVTPIVVIGQEEDSFTVAGYFTPTDAGQARMLALRISRATANARMKWDGTNGMTCPVIIRNRRIAASAESATLQTVAFECRVNGTKVIVGTGPIV